MGVIGRHIRIRIDNSNQASLTMPREATKDPNWIRVVYGDGEAIRLLRKHSSVTQRGCA